MFLDEEAAEGIRDLSKRIPLFLSISFAPLPQVIMSTISWPLPPQLMKYRDPFIRSRGSNDRNTISAINWKEKSEKHGKLMYAVCSYFQVCI